MKIKRPMAQEVCKRRLAFRDGFYLYHAMIKVSIDKSLVGGEAEKAAFGIVKDSIERSFKKFEKEVNKEGGSVTVTITGPGAFDMSMDNLSLKLRRKIASASKKMLGPQKLKS